MMQSLVRAIEAHDMEHHGNKKGYIMHIMM
jgi:hypothetical protein